MLQITLLLLQCWQACSHQYSRRHCDARAQCLATR